MNNKSNQKLGFYISFKQSEKDLYEKIKSLNNYSQVIKEMMKDYFINQNNSVSNRSDKTITLTIDDLCRVISSVNSPHVSSNVVTPKTKEVINKNEDLKLNLSTIPDDMLVGL